MTVNKKWNEDDVVSDAIGERTFQASADWFNERLPEKFQITRMSVYNWCVGAHQADHQFLNALIVFYQDVEDERRRMAETLLEMRREKMRKSHVVGATDEDGKKLLKAVKVQS